MIYTLIPAVMADIDAIGKNRQNTEQGRGFNFRGIDDVMNKMKPIFSKHQVFVVPEVLEQARETKTTRSGSELRYSLLKIRFSFFAPDGSHVDAVTIGEGMDSGDKASNKAMSIAFKYALFQVFCIPTEEMRRDDQEAHTPEETVPFKPSTYVRQWCDKNKLEIKQFGAYRAKLVDEGKMEDIKTSSMSREQVEAMLALVQELIAKEAS